jgi:adenosylmethionine-8-amino-7-oxononanoate aminotransferase
VKLDARREALLRKTFIDFWQMSEFVRDPLILDRAEGLYCWDIDGKRYFDAIGGIFVATLGHRHPRVMEAMRKQMERMTFGPPLHDIADITLDFIEKIGTVTPGNLKYVKPFSGGSESTEAAMKFVRQYFKQTGHPGKYKFISRYHGYHGGTAGAMAASGTGSRKSKFEPHMTGFLKVFPPTFYRGRFATWEECNRFAAQSIEDVILHEDPETVAGVMLEPIGNTGGIITPTPEYFRMIRQICDSHNVALIFDEVITGFAKTGSMFAAQTFGRHAGHYLLRQGTVERRDPDGRDDRTGRHGGRILGRSGKRHTIRARPHIRGQSAGLRGRNRGYRRDRREQAVRQIRAAW